MVLELYCDGASRGNPGLSGIGVSVMRGEKEVAFVSKFVGKKTNNEAEYLAVIEGMKKVGSFKEPVIIYLDSQLVVKQLKGEYRVKAKTVIPLHEKAKKLLEKVEVKDIIWVRREKNKRADELANEALDTI